MRVFILSEKRLTYECADTILNLMDGSEAQAAGVEQETGFDERKSFSGNRILKRVTSQGMYKTHDSEGNYVQNPSQRVTDIEGLRELAREEYGRTKIDYGKERPVPPVEELEVKARDLMQEGIKRLVERGVLTVEMVDLASKWITVDDVEVVEKGTTGYHYTPERDDVFPEGEERPKILIPVKLVTNKMNHYQTYFESMGVEVSDEDLLDLSLESIAIHEWSHGLERAISIQAFENMRNLPEFEKDEDEYDAHLARYTVLSSSLDNSPAVHPTSSRIEQDAFSERYATGFEFIDTLHALPEHGVDEAKAQEFVDALYEERKARLEEFDNMRMATGYDDQEFEIFCDDIKESASQNDIKMNIIQPWSGVGYYAPLSERELKAVSERGYQKSVNGEDLRGILEQSKKRYQAQ